VVSRSSPATDGATSGTVTFEDIGLYDEWEKK